MSGDTEQLKRKLDEMLTSNDPEWVNAVVVTLNAMYRQFELEQQTASLVFLLMRAARSDRRSVPDDLL